MVGFLLQGSLRHLEGTLAVLSVLASAQELRSLCHGNTSEFSMAQESIPEAGQFTGIAELG